MDDGHGGVGMWVSACAWIRLSKADSAAVVPETKAMVSGVLCGSKR